MSWGHIWRQTFFHQASCDSMCLNEDIVANTDYRNPLNSVKSAKD